MTVSTTILSITTPLSITLSATILGSMSVAFLIVMFNVIMKNVVAMNILRGFDERRHFEKP